MAHPAGETPLRNHDVDWDTWPVEEYLTENYREVHPADLAVIDHHSRYYRQFPADTFERSVEFGAGPNLYPLMLAAGVSRHIHAIEPSANSVAYLRQQLRDVPEASWAAFYQACRERLPTLPEDPRDALSRVTVAQVRAQDVDPGAYDLGSMHFVAESVTEDRDEFEALCGLFVRSVRPEAPVVAAFMENMGRYGLGDGSRWPGYPVDADKVAAAFDGITTELHIDRIDADETLPDYGYTGMVLLTARRAA